MNRKMLTTAVVAGFACVAMCGAAFAGPRGGHHHPGPRPAHHFRPAPMHHHHHSFWGRGGRHFWPGFAGGVVGGVVGGVLYDTVVTPAPVVVTTPTVVTTTPVVATTVSTVQNVWVEGRYVDQVQANGTVVRVWQPGHYEQRTVVVQ